MISIPRNFLAEIKGFARIRSGGMPRKIGVPFDALCVVQTVNAAFRSAVGRRRPAEGGEL